MCRIVTLTYNPSLPPFSHTDLALVGSRSAPGASVHAAFPLLIGESRFAIAAIRGTLIGNPVARRLLVVWVGWIRRRRGGRQMSVALGCIRRFVCLRRCGP